MGPYWCDCDDEVHFLSLYRPLELTAVEETGFEDKPSLKSRQEGNL